MNARILLAMVLVSACSFAQQSGTAQNATSQTAPATAAPPPGKKTKFDVTKNEAFSEDIAEALLSRITQGMTRRNPKIVLSAFDPAKFPDYPEFAERTAAVLEQYDSFRIFYRITNTTLADGRATAQADLTIERTSRNRGNVPVRTHMKARFDFERGAKGWRIVAMDPSDLLTK